MELKFLGRGSAFNVKEGNTAAYFVDDDQLFLIDCGEDVFAKLKQKSLLGRVRAVNLMITHTHSDHIGSLGSLVTYLYLVLHRPLKIILPDNDEYVKTIEQILQGFGCTEEMYDLVHDTQYDEKFKSFSGVRYVKTWHCAELMSFGLIFTTKDGLVYYSGDTKEIKNLHYLLSKGGADRAGLYRCDFGEEFERGAFVCGEFSDGGAGKFKKADLLYAFQ